MSEEESNQDKTVEEKSLVDELDVEGIRQGKYFAHGRLLSAASRQMPVVEFSEETMILHPPQKPFDERPADEVVSVDVDERGIVLDETKRPRKIVGAKFHGREIWWLGEQKPGTLKHYACWLDDAGLPRKLFIQGQPVTTDLVYKLRNRTHDGELSIFPDLAGED